MAREKAEKAEEATAEHKYVVSDLAELLGVTPQSTRVFLRSIEAEREGRSYGWDTKAELDALVKQYESRSKKEAEAPAKAAKAKVGATRRSRKEAA